MVHGSEEGKSDTSGDDEAPLPCCQIHRTLCVQLIANTAACSCLRLDYLPSPLFPPLPTNRECPLSCRSLVWQWRRNQQQKIAQSMVPPTPPVRLDPNYTRGNPTRPEAIPTLCSSPHTSFMSVAYLLLFVKTMCFVGSQGEVKEHRLLIRPQLYFLIP